MSAASSPVPCTIGHVRARVWHAYYPRKLVWVYFNLNGQTQSMLDRPSDLHLYLICITRYYILFINIILGYPLPSNLLCILSLFLMFVMSVNGQARIPNPACLEYETVYWGDKVPCSVVPMCVSLLPIPHTLLLAVTVQRKAGTTPGMSRKACPRT